MISCQPLYPVIAELLLKMLESDMLTPTPWPLAHSVRLQSSKRLGLDPHDL